MWFFSRSYLGRNNWVAIGLLAFWMLVPHPAFAAIQLPKNMSVADREEALRIVGFGTSSKILSDPYPLGGHAGFEAGLSLENVVAEDLSRLGNGVRPPQQEVLLSKLTIGKGVYNDVDLFLQFTPYTKQEELAQYGGFVRWGFYQASYLPVGLSLIAHVNSANIGNQLNARSYGADLIAGVNVDNLALYIGGGVIESSGIFLVDEPTPTDPEARAQAKSLVTGSHALVGANLRFSQFFLSLQIDRYTLPVFSAKLGVRF